MLQGLGGECSLPSHRVTLISDRNLPMGAKATKATQSELSDLWHKIARQVDAAGLGRGVQLAVPPGDAHFRSESTDGRKGDKGHPVGAERSLAQDRQAGRCCRAWAGSAACRPTG